MFFARKQRVQTLQQNKYRKNKNKSKILCMWPLRLDEANVKVIGGLFKIKKRIARMLMYTRKQQLVFLFNLA